MFALPKYMPLAVCIFISSHQEMEGISPPFKSRLETDFNSRMHRDSIMLGLNTSILVLGILWRYHKGMAIYSSILAWKITYREAWWATVHGVAKESDMMEQLTLAYLFTM